MIKWITLLICATCRWNNAVSVRQVYQKSDPINDGKMNSIVASCFSTDHSLMCIATDNPKSGVNRLSVYNNQGMDIQWSRDNTVYKGLKFSNKLDRLVSICYDGSMEIHYLTGRPSIFHKREDCNLGGCSVLDVHLSQEDTKMISSYSDGLIRIWDSTGNLMNSFQSNMTLQDADFTPDGKLIYSFDADSTLKLWDLQGNLIYTYNGHTAFFTKDGNRLYTINNHQTDKNKTGHGSELRDYFTPQGTYNYFKSNNTFTTKKDNSLHSKWLRLLEWLGLG